jgi:hypothetical protein
MSTRPNKHLYFKGDVKGFLIRHDKIISIEIYRNGIEIMKDGANPKPQVFKVDDPWFASNLLSGLG